MSTEPTMSGPRGATPTIEDRPVNEMWRLWTDAQEMLNRTAQRVNDAYHAGDTAAITWLHKQIVSLERRSQERDDR